MSVINLQEHKIRRMADSHDSFRIAAALMEVEGMSDVFRAKEHKPAPVSDEDRKYAMGAREAEQARLITERIRRNGGEV